MEDEPDGWPHGEEDTDELTPERLGYVSERANGKFWVTVMGMTQSPQPGHGKVICAWTPFEAESEEAVVRQAKERYPDINIVPQYEWDKVFFPAFSRLDTGRPSSQLGGKGKRVAAERGRGYRPRVLQTSGSPGLSAAGLPENWGRGGRTGLVSERRSRTSSAGKGIDESKIVQNIKDGVWPLDEWVPIVQLAKRLGYPPQYLYNAVYHGKIQTQGEKPKKAEFKTVLAKYRPSILREVEHES